jgi:hypothetical protein
MPAVPNVVAPSKPAPEVPAVPVATERNFDLPMTGLIPVGGVVPPVLPAVPAEGPSLAAPPAGPAEAPVIPPAGPAEAPVIPPPSVSRPPAPAPEKLIPPAATPTAPELLPPTDPLVAPPADTATPVKVPLHTNATLPAATKFRIILRVGEGEPMFEVRHGDDLVMKVLCEKIDIKSPEKGQGLSAVTATGKVRFVGFCAEGTCDSFSFLAGTGEVAMSGSVKVQVKDKIGRVESELIADQIRYKLDTSAMPGVLKP